MTIASYVLKIPTPCYTWDCIQQDMVEHPAILIGIVAVIVYLAWRKPTVRP